MVKGKQIKLLMGAGETAEAVGMATSVSVELTADLEEYDALPGSSEDDGWTRYRVGDMGWNVSHDGLAMYASIKYWLEGVLADDEELTATVRVCDGENDDPILDLTGTVHLSEASVVAQRGSLAKLTGKLVCDGFPELVEY